MPREADEAKAARTTKIIVALQRVYPNAHCELDYGDPLELPIAVILSAQCTDKRVNIVTAELFKKYRSARSANGLFGSTGSSLHEPRVMDCGARAKRRHRFRTECGFQRRCVALRFPPQSRMRSPLQVHGENRLARRRFRLTPEPPSAKMCPRKEAKCGQSRLSPASRTL
jgi:hypothetical protein